MAKPLQLETSKWLKNIVFKLLVQLWENLLKPPAKFVYRWYILPLAAQENTLLEQVVFSHCDIIYLFRL